MDTHRRTFVWPTIVFGSIVVTTTLYCLARNLVLLCGDLRSPSGILCITCEPITGIMLSRNPSPWGTLYYIYRYIQIYDTMTHPEGVRRTPYYSIPLILYRRILIYVLTSREGRSPRVTTFPHIFPILWLVVLQSVIRMSYIWICVYKLITIKYTEKYTDIMVINRKIFGVKLGGIYPSWDYQDPNKIRHQPPFGRFAGK